MGPPLPHPDTFRNKDVRLLLKLYPATVATPIASSAQDGFPGIWASGFEDLESILWPSDAWAIVEWSDD